MCLRIIPLLGARYFCSQLGREFCCVPFVPFGCCGAEMTWNLAELTDELGAAAVAPLGCTGVGVGIGRADSSFLTPLARGGLGEAAAAADSLRTRVTAGVVDVGAAGFLVMDADGCSLPLDSTDGTDAGGAGESVEPPRPETCMVILVDEDCCSLGTFSLILGWTGSSTTALACLISLLQKACRYGQRRGVQFASSREPPTSNCSAIL